MTAVAINQPVGVAPTPFCVTSCKSIRVFCRFLGQSLYALGLLIVSVACRIFSRDLAHMYLSMARAQFNQGGNALITYFKLGARLIDFSYNGCVIAPSAETEQKALRARYGSDTIDRWLQIGTEEIPLEPEKLKRVEHGICLGMTLNFVKQYLQQIQASVSPIEAIRKISSQYVTGAPEEAQLAQVFYSALDSTHLIEREWARFDATLEREEKANLQWLKNQQDSIRTLPRDRILKELSNLETQCDERLNSFRCKALSNKITTIANIEAKRAEIVSSKFGLQMGAPRIYAHEEISTKNDSEFSKFLEELPYGCYIGGFRAKECAHAVTLIKSVDSQYFFFDPNLGTFVFEAHEIAEKLWNISKSFYLKNGMCSLSFSSCRLS